MNSENAFTFPYGSLGGEYSCTWLFSPALQEAGREKRKTPLYDQMFAEYCDPKEYKKSVS